MKKALKVLIGLDIALGLLLMLAPVGYIFALNFPGIYYNLNPQALEVEISSLVKPPAEDKKVVIDTRSGQGATEAPLNLSLPTQNKLIVPSVGIDTEIREGTNEKSILAKGVWHLPDYGTPTKSNKPFILAAHRWGPTHISPEYRSKNMFINLPNVRVGDEVIVIWQQREYFYTVDKVEESTYVSRVSDLTLITCKYFDSEVRVFVYASLKR